LVGIDVSWWVIGVVIGVLPVSVTGITWGETVVRLFRVVWSISLDETTEVASANQFFFFVLKCLALIHGVAVILVILAVLGHICIGGIQGFAWLWNEARLECFIEKL